MQLLKELDKIVEHKLTYRNEHENQLAQEKKEAITLTAKSKQEKYHQIFKTYARFQTDSATVYLNKMVQTPPSNDSIKNLYRIGRAEIYAVTGSYTEARAILKSIDSQELSHDVRLEYYHLCRTLYGWMTDFAVLPQTKEEMKELTRKYRDSILIEEKPGINRNIVLADSANVNHLPQLALQLSIADSAKAQPHEKTFIYNNMAIAYGNLGKREEQIQYLARTAMSDLKRGTTEYEALQHLALLCYEMNDPERAYHYLVCAMEDANFCKARLRSMEASSIFPIIDRAYKEQELERHKMTRTLIYGLCTLALILVLMILSLRSQMRRLSVTRKQLALANQKLEEVNKSLIATAKVKEEYIARYLERCRSYIDSFESFRRTLLKRYKAHQMEALYKELKSEETIQNEQERFFEDFDNAFLNLYPTFVEQFNNLLVPEAHFIHKNGDLLTTELRIFALIRLGVTDSQRIAHFLNYSVATIYCYRSKMRNKAKGDKATFEQQVMEL